MICSLSSKEVELYQYQTKKTPKAIGSMVFKVFFKDVVKKNQFNKLVSSLGKTNAGLNFLAASISILA